jgi:DNA-binding response OmpR family regulator
MPEQCQILVVEDAFVRSFLRAALERLGHEVICAQAEEALAQLRKGEIDLLVTNKPAEFAEFGEAVPLIYVAAFPDPSAAVAFRRWLPLRKPFQAAELTAAVERLLGTR